MAPVIPPREWPAALARCWIDTARILSTTSDEDEMPGRDSLGNPGRVRVVKHLGKLGVNWPRSRVVEQLVSAGLRPTRSTAEETELADPRADGSQTRDPFMLERSVVVTVQGRDLPERQRAVIETKVAALRLELADAAITPERRAGATKMLEKLEKGLQSVLDVRAVVRRFRPAIEVTRPVEQIGTYVQVRAGTRIVYEVGAKEPEPGDDLETEPMVFHVLALGAREAVLLYTGGVHGTRHLRDLETSRMHHAWFANRERVKTEATAPWIGRAVYRELVEKGSSELVVHKRRDPGPISVEKTGEATHSLRVDGKTTEVPVMTCRTSRDDEMLILADAGNPLVLRLYESGAELVRTVLAVDSRGARAALIVAAGETEEAG